MMDFVFPFSTCENVNSSGMQPVSALVNIMTTLILVVCIFISNKMPVKIALGSFAMFEAFHAFSHIKHIPGAIQTNIVHVLGYLMSFATLYAILALGGKRSHGMAQSSILILMGLVALDLYVWIFVKGIYTIFTGLAIFASVVVLNHDILPRLLKRGLPFLLAGLLIIFGLFVNEHYNCERMMRYKEFPYHIAVEIMGLVLFTALAIMLL